MAEDSLILQSVGTHKDSANYHAWLDSPLHPTSILPKLANLDPKKTCEDLHALPEDQLSIFRDALEIDTKLHCKDVLLDKTNTYFQYKKELLKWRSSYSHETQKPFSSTTPRKFTQEHSFGPSREQNVNTTGGPIFISGDLNYKEVAITFDDGPHGTLTPELLDILKSENLQVTFFSVGRNVKKYPAIVNQINEDRHSLGNHSWSHPNMRKLKHRSSVNQIESTFQQIQQEMDFYIPFFRFPYGNYTSKLKTYLKRNDISSFFWNIDTLDWKYSDPEFLLDYALEQVEKTEGGIVLFHDVQPQTIAIMPAFLQTLKNNGYKPVVYRTQSERN
jgi:peptidoglycan/xylan/chitin deacetylase (PgdA/CDA1 family)